MISKELEATLNFALKEAKNRRHEYVSLEHLLYALLRDKDGKAAIVACGGDVDRLNKSLEEFFNGQMETLPEGWDQEPQQTLSFHRVLQRAVIHAQSAERKEINGGNLLIAMYREAANPAAAIPLARRLVEIDPNDARLNELLDALYHEMGTTAPPNPGEVR